MTTIAQLTTKLKAAEAAHNLPLAARLFNLIQRQRYREVPRAEIEGRDRRVSGMEGQS
jgi:hypothetical protein